MSINWFPGHMHKARKEIAEVMPQVDVIIEMIDARIPFSSENPLVPELRGDKPVIKVLNKADLADPATTALWVAHMEQQKGIRALPLTQQKPDEIKSLLALCHEMVPDRDKELRGVRAMIMGIPNVGKSTLINTLAGRIIAKTGNEAGVTKSQQRIKLEGNIILTDTPGFLWPKLSPASCGYRLAVTGAIKDTVIDYADIALFAAEYLLKAYPERLMDRYQLSELPGSDMELMDAIAQRRGCMRKGGVSDLHKVSEILIHELRLGQLGSLTLETPDMVSQEQIEAKEEEARRAADKAERDKVRQAKARKRYGK
ncbi:ribosome biogenesis GTPase YlqF [Aeromonas schubertii]|uniref:Ribosome biogenesis GTPase A n=2 Tax=Aeromonas schubertii TaxID=652 RepID=A0ABS7VG17_9GAMM|nr:ribosome biogenesis GTPase YlqF [Aeromonas schubertii]KUE81336.1 ribosome biogenesis GTPase YlqF [Aeromonas schubertii]MBZ6068344.1 ribosome biogenesis GTPase YlqF [Aeromonas schubertii]MBZ6073132.1 ribosome biogenesis GTPase YlqF [Aeromonas schubertii]